MSAKGSGVMTSLRTVIRDDWLFKVSELTGTICIVAYNKTFNWTNVRFFHNENSAHTHIEYLCLTTEQANASLRGNSVQGEDTPGG